VACCGVISAGVLWASTHYPESSSIRTQAVGSGAAQVWDTGCRGCPCSHWWKTTSSQWTAIKPSTIS